MDIQASARAVARASKAYRHATRQLEGATSETARRRHARRALNAQRSMSEARRFFEETALYSYTAD